MSYFSTKPSVVPHYNYVGAIPFLDLGHIWEPRFLLLSMLSQIRSRSGCSIPVKAILRLGLKKFDCNAGRLVEGRMQQCSECRWCFGPNVNVYPTSVSWFALRVPAAHTLNAGSDCKEREA